MTITSPGEIKVSNSSSALINSANIFFNFRVGPILKNVHNDYDMSFDFAYTSLITLHIYESYDIIYMIYDISVCYL